MLSNYILIAWRNLLKNKVHSLINMLGLALGMAGAILILLNILHGFSFDQFHEKKANLFTAYNKAVVGGKLRAFNVTAPPLAAALQNEFPEIKQASRVMGSNRLLRNGDKMLNSSGSFVDNAFLEMFSFPLVAGNIKTVFNDPNNIVITEKLSRKLFNTGNPLNKIITTPTGDNFTVTGVLKDLPENTRFRFEYLLPMKYMETNGRSPGGWNQQLLFTFLELNDGVNVDLLNKKIETIAARNSSSLEKQQVFLYEFHKEHLYGRVHNGKPDGGGIDNLKMLAILAGVILLIACINFMNLSTARSEKRAKEVGVRKVVGAGRRSLILQFIIESVMLAACSGVIAFVLVEFAVPYFSELIKTELSIPWDSFSFWLMVIGFILITGLLAGSYPAFYLSSFKPVKVIKGVSKTPDKIITPRKVLVVLQFTCAIFLINFTIVFQKQILHGLKRDTGYAKDELIFQQVTDELAKNYAALKNELVNSGVATSVCTSNTMVNSSTGEESGLKWTGMDPDTNPSFVLMETGGDFVRTNGLTLVSGRDLDLDRYPEDTLSCMINEATAKVLGFKEPVGNVIEDVDLRWKIVGVVNDFLIGDPGDVSKPVLIKGGKGRGQITVRLASTSDLLSAAQQVESIMKKHNTGFLTEIRLANEIHEEKFRTAKNRSTLINVFAFLAIFVSCLGLLGLSNYMAENRKREIGIRKVLGADVATIAALLSGSFVKLIVVAILIASPLSWLAMNDFLQGFAYRTNMSIWVLLGAAAGAILLALLTIAIQTIRSAMANPVNILLTD